MAPFNLSYGGPPDSVEAVVQWIRQTVPCFQGQIPIEWTMAVGRALFNAGVQPSIIEEAMAKAGDQGYLFYPPRQSDTGHNPGHHGLPEPPRVGSPEPPDPALAIQYAARLEIKFLEAQRMGDVAGMEAVIAAFLALLAQILKGRGKMKGEQDKLDQIRERILQAAPTVGRTIRRDIRPAGPREPMPMPDGLHGRRIVLPPPTPRRVR